MFGWRKRLNEKLELLEGMLARALARLEQRDEDKERLIEQNKDLFDRLMSRNFEEFKIYQPDDGGGFDERKAGIAPDQDESNAGEILSLEEGS